MHGIYWIAGIVAILAITLIPGLHWLGNRSRSTDPDFNIDDYVENRGGFLRLK